jgi:hypothetical protein
VYAVLRPFAIIRSTSMGKLGNGPDMQDCAAYLAEMQSQQNCSTTVLLEVVGSVVGCRLVVHVLSVERGCLGPGAGWTVATTALWPNRNSKTFEGCLFNAIVSHDAEIGRRHFQEAINLA